jgi:hypothetical protein
VKRARALARLNGRILGSFSERTTTALRGALPLRLALPHLEPVLALNVAKEIRKDTLVILRARELADKGMTNWDEVLPHLLDATKEIDRMFLGQVRAFPVGVVIRYEEIAPIRARRMKLLYEAALKVLATENGRCSLRGALQTSFPPEEFEQLLFALFRLYADETRSLSRSVRLPRLLVPLREFIAQELLNVMLGVARPLALEIAATVSRPHTSIRRPQNPVNQADAVPSP